MKVATWRGESCFSVDDVPEPEPNAATGGSAPTATAAVALNAYGAAKAAPAVPTTSAAAAKMLNNLRMNDTP